MPASGAYYHDSGPALVALGFEGPGYSHPFWALPVSGDPLLHPHTFGQDVPPPSHWSMDLSRGLFVT